MGTLVIILNAGEKKIFDQKMHFKIFRMVKILNVKLHGFQTRDLQISN